MKPAFVDGELVGFAASIGHMAEIGGKTPGGFAADATEVFQEGYRLPPVKIVEGGEDVESIWKIILNNVRTPRVTYGDLRALVSSVDLGQRRLEDLVGRYGMAEFTPIVEDVQTYSERRMRSFLESIPNGTYEGVDHMDDDGPFKLNVNMERFAATRSSLTGAGQTTRQTGRSTQRSVSPVRQPGMQSSNYTMVKVTCPSTRAPTSQFTLSPLLERSLMSTTPSRRSEETQRHTPGWLTPSTGRWPSRCRTRSRQLTARLA